MRVLHHSEPGLKRYIRLFLITKIQSLCVVYLIMIKNFHLVIRIRQWQIAVHTEHRFEQRLVTVGSRPGSDNKSGHTQRLLPVVWHTIIGATAIDV